MKESAEKISSRLRLICLSALLAAGVLAIAELSGDITRLPQSESNLTFAAGVANIGAQGPDLDYSAFRHNSQRHASLACTSCHERGADNSAAPKFPAHKACTNCHLAQFVTPAIPMCQICHTNVQSSAPPLKSFPSRFNENFNVKFDHAQHMTGVARPRNGCNGCHDKPLLRGVAWSIPVGLNAHNDCYTCHTPSSKSNAGREMASCGVCHDQKPFARTSTSSRAFRFAFSHAKHGTRQRLACTDCHSLTAGAPQSHQVSSPAPAEHFPSGRTNCLTCHNGKRSFGGDLAFKDCRRCHAGQTFRWGDETLSMHRRPAVSQAQISIPNGRTHGRVISRSGRRTLSPLLRGNLKLLSLNTPSFSDIRRTSLNGSQTVKRKLSLLSDSQA